MLVVSPLFINDKEASTFLTNDLRVIVTLAIFSSVVKEIYIKIISILIPSFFLIKDNLFF